MKKGELTVDIHNVWLLYLSSLEHNGPWKDLEYEILENPTNDIKAHGGQ